MKIISIGRSENCNIQINDPKVSRVHAMLRIYSSGKMEIIDRSSNGTFIDNKRIQPDIPYKVTRGNVVKFATDQLLDWDRVPNPLAIYKIAIMATISIIVVVGVYCIIRKNIIDPIPDTIVTPVEDDNSNNDRNSAVDSVDVDNVDAMVQQIQDNEENRDKRKKEAAEKEKEKQRKLEEENKQTEDQEHKKEEKEAENNTIIL